MRIIPRLDIKSSKLIKGIRLEGLRVIGDPVSYTNDYISQGADEILYIDSVASLYNRNSLHSLLSKVADVSNVPLVAGGGIKLVSEARKLIQNGADKIALNTAAVSNPALINDISLHLGNQAVVVSIQARKNNSMSCGWEVMTECGREKTNISVFNWLLQLQNFNVGEIFLTSVDQDGTQQGPDLELVELAHNLVKVPLIYSGGISSLDDVVSLAAFKNLSAICIGSALHNRKLSIPDIKNSISSLRSIHYFSTLTPIDSKSIYSTTINSNTTIGIVDIGLGNIRSVYNCLNCLDYDVKCISDHKLVNQFDMLLLPGVGSFGAAVQLLHRTGFYDAIKKRAYQNLPIIGICLGMQLFGKSGEEGVGEVVDGLSLINQDVVHLREMIPNDSVLVKEPNFPHVGWSTLFPYTENTQAEINSSDSFYFVHSYGFSPTDELQKVYTTTYKSISFTSFFMHNNVAGFQFHPEKSGPQGVKLLNNIIHDLID